MVLARLRAYLTARHAGSRRLQAELDFGAGCTLLEVHEAIAAGLSEPAKIMELYNNLRAKWAAADLARKVAFANDSMTIQLAELCQAVADVDAGDVGLPPAPPLLPPDQRAIASAFQPSPSPSSHTSPAPSLAFQMKEVYRDEAADAGARTREALRGRTGFALWVGPSQAAAPVQEDGNGNGDADGAAPPLPPRPLAGVYLKGNAPPGSVVALIPGCVYNGEMLRTPRDGGHLANPAAAPHRRLIPRLDECVIDVLSSPSRAAAEANPYALGHLVRHPPRGVVPNVMRLQVDFMATPKEAGPGADGLLPFPAHLRDYIPNPWGADVGLGQQLYGGLEQGVWAKGMALIALRPLWNEELFVDWALNPYGSGSGGRKALPAWYTPLDDDAARRIWKGIGE